MPSTLPEDTRGRYGLPEGHALRPYRGRIDTRQPSLNRGFFGLLGFGGKVILDCIRGVVHECRRVVVVASNATRSPG